MPSRFEMNSLRIKAEEAKAKATKKKRGRPKKEDK